MKLYKNSWLFLLAVILILVVVFVPTLMFDRMLGKDVDKFMEKVNEITELEVNDEAIFERCKELEVLWKKHMDNWSFVVHHSAIEKVDLSITTFIEYSRKGEKNSAELEAKKLEKLLEITAKQDKPELLNIL